MQIKRRSKRWYAHDLEVIQIVAGMKFPSNDQMQRIVFCKYHVILWRFFNSKINFWQVQRDHEWELFHPEAGRHARSYHRFVVKLITEPS